MIQSRSVMMPFIAFILVACQTTPSQKIAVHGPHRIINQVKDTTAAPDTESVTVTATREKNLPPEHLPPHAIVIDSKYFKTVYDPQRNIAYYSEYNLTAAHLRMPKVGRSNKFHPDPFLLQSGLTAVTPSWYNKTGYDRGHLAPSGDFNWDTDANYATFSMANMTPQKPNLNRIAWEALEAQVRKWACAEEDVEIVVGPVLKDSLPKMGDQDIPVPEYFFKVILSHHNPQKAIAFILSQEDRLRTDYPARVVTIADVEKQTGLELLQTELPTNDPIRTHADINEWKEADCTPAPAANSGG